MNLKGFGEAVFLISLLLIQTLAYMSGLNTHLVVESAQDNKWRVYSEGMNESNYRFDVGQVVSGLEIVLYVISFGNDVNNDYMKFVFVGEEITDSSGTYEQLVGIARVGYNNDSKLTVGYGKHLMYYVLPKRSFVSYVNITLYSRGGRPTLDLSRSVIREWDPKLHYVSIPVWRQGWAVHNITGDGRGRIALLCSGAGLPQGCPKDSGIFYVFGKGFSPPKIGGKPDVYVDFSYLGGFNAAPETSYGKGNYRCKIDVGFGSGNSLNEAYHSGLNQTLYLVQKYTSETTYPLVWQDTAKGTIDVFLEVGKTLLESPLAKTMLEALGYVSFAYDIAQAILSLSFDEIVSDAKILVWENVNVNQEKELFAYFSIFCQVKCAGLTGTIANFYGESPWGRPLLEGLFGARIFELPAGGMFVGGILLHYYIPIVVSVEPLGEGLPIDTRITIKFSKPIDRGSIVKRPDTIVATANSKPINFFEFFHFRESGSDQKILVMSPNYHLDYNTVYVINFTSNILDVEGFQLEPFTITFSTEQGPPPPKNIYYNVSVAVSTGLYEFGEKLRGSIFRAEITKDNVQFDFRTTPILADAVFRTNDPLFDYWNEGSGLIFKVGDKVYLKLATAKDGGVPPRSGTIFKLVEELKMKNDVWAEARVEEVHVGNPTVLTAFKEQAGLKPGAFFTLEPIVVREYAAIGEKIGVVTFFSDEIKDLNGRTLPLYAVIRSNVFGIIPDKPSPVFNLKVGSPNVFMPVDFVVYVIRNGFVGAWRLTPKYEEQKQYTYRYTIQAKGITAEVYVFSNSTVTGFSYDEIMNALSFKVTGKNGTYGYVNLAIPKTFGEIKPTVFLDHEQIKYELNESNNIYYVRFTYSHPTHNVTIYLVSTFASTEQPTTETGRTEAKQTEINYILIAAFVTSLIIILSFAFLYKKRK